MLQHLFLSVLVVMSTAIISLAADPPAGDSSAVPTPEKVRLWEGDAPGALGQQDVDIPTITIFRPSPEKSTGATIIVCPGGGYSGLAAHEGQPVAEWLNTVGVTGIVLKYRLGPKYHHPVELGDASRAIRMVRANAQKWNLDPKRVGILGFSAGGHLASTAATHFDDGQADSTDPIEKMSSRPDLAILVYPVVTLNEPFVHRGSKKNLLGDKPDESLVELLSNEKQVTAKTPPCFLVHGADDKGVPVQNSIEFALACLKNNVPVELHVYDHGPHGFGLGGKDPVLSTWPQEAARWLDRRGFTQKH